MRQQASGIFLTGGSITPLPNTEAMIDASMDAGLQDWILAGELHGYVENRHAFDSVEEKRARTTYT